MELTDVLWKTSRARTANVRKSATQRFALICVLLLLGGQVQSQPADWFRAAERSEPHEALEFFERTWSVPGKTGWRESCAWLPEGRRHIVCKPRWENAKGSAEGLSVYSFDEANGVYVSPNFKANGTMAVESGRRIPGGFQFASESGVGAERVRERLTLEEAADGRVSVVSESAKGDGPWVIGRKTEYLRTRP